MSVGVPWLSGPSDAARTWPTAATEVPAAACSLGVPDGWGDGDRPVGPDGHGQGWTYQGTTPVDWLSVRHRLDPGAEGELSRWVDVTLRALGFPVVPPSDLAFDLPRLAEWSDASTDADDRQRLGLDELRCHRGLATWESHRMRLYVVLARRGDEAWLVTLSMETAAAPGMPAEVGADDDLRAGAVFGPLSLG